MKPHILILAWMVLSSVAWADDGVRPEGFEIPRSAVHQITSATLDRSYEIYVKTPPGYASPENADKIYPVIYLNDGPYTFQVASGITHLPMNTGAFEPAILVGISFAQGEKGMDSRVRDLTPSRDASWKKYETGGGPAYLTFLEQEVFALIEEEYRADPANRTLAGQSLGGSFGAWVVLTRPDLFKNYILTSPSLWFNDNEIFDLEARYAAAHDDLTANVYFAVGSMERKGNGMRNDMVGDQVEFVRRLRARNYPSLRLKDDIVEGALHVTTFPIGFTNGAQWLFHTNGDN